MYRFYPDPCSITLVAEALMGIDSLDEYSGNHLKDYPEQIRRSM
jgi:hypothetical protein